MRTTPQRNLIIIILLAALCGLSAFPKAGTAAPLMEPVNPGITNLEAWWSLDEASGTRNDSHGSNHLTDNNTVGNTTGKQGNAAQFVSANSEYLSISDNASLSMGDIAFTITGWFYRSTASDQYLLAKGNTASIYTYEYIIRIYPDNTSQFFVSNGSNQRQWVTVSSVTSGAWYFFAVQHDPTGNVINYRINNAAPASASYTYGGFDGSSPLYIGNALNHNLYHNGYVDEVGIWKTLLSTDEIDWLYNSGNGRTYCDLEGACSTPTPTASNTSTPTITFTPSNTPTATFTPSNTPTFTNTVPGVTDTFTPTITFTPSDTPTITFTPSITSTPTITFTPSITPTPGEFATAFWDGEITYGDAANVTVLSLLCLIMVVGLMAWFVTTYLQRKRKS